MEGENAKEEKIYRELELGAPIQDKDLVNPLNAPRAVETRDLAPHERKLLENLAV